MYHSDQALLDDIKSVEGYVRSELNVDKLTLKSETTGVVQLVASANGKRLGKRLGKAFGTVRAKVAELTSEQVGEFQAKQEIEVEGHKLVGEDIDVARRFAGDEKTHEASWNLKTGELVVIDCTVDDSQVRLSLL